MHHKLYVIEGFKGMLYVFSCHCYCRPAIYLLSLYSVKDNRSVFKKIYIMDENDPLSE